jgi:hypothetical protein
MRLWKWRSDGNHKTISTGPWKSRTEREIPTFPQANLLLGFRGEERRMNRPRSGSLSERRTGLLSERRLHLCWTTPTSASISSTRVAVASRYSAARHTDGPHPTDFDQYCQGQPISDCRAQPTNGASSVRSNEAPKRPVRLYLLSAVCQPKAENVVAGAGCRHGQRASDWPRHDAFNATCTRRFY